MKRLVSIVLLAFMLFGLVACNPSGTTDGGDATPAVAVTGITLNESTKNLAVGAQFSLTATVAPADATDRTVQFVSSNTAVATVSTTGNVTAVSEGVAAIVAVTTNGKIAICTISVADSDTPNSAETVDVTGVTLDKSGAPLAIGGSLQLTATVAPENATNKTVTYITSNAAVATVDATGKVTAVANGNATIFVITTNGKIASCEISVSSQLQSALRDKNKTYRIMFVGNSYTFQSDMPENLFAKVCADAGYTVQVDRFANGSHFLWKHSNALHDNIAGTQQVTGKQLDDALKNNKYDFVVIQEQGWNSQQDLEMFYTGARLMAEKVHANGAELYMYQTWGYKDGCTAFEANFGGLPENYKIGEMRVRAAYAAIAEEIGASLCYVGPAFTNVHTNYGTKINLYDPDCYHPSIAGSALAAYTIFSNIFGEDVRSINCDLLTTTNIAEDEASLASKNHIVLTDINVATANSVLRDAAYRAAFVDHAVDPAYKMSSRGIGYTPVVDITKTENLTTMPSSAPISGGITGTNGQLSYTLTNYTAGETLTKNQKTQLADTAYGVSVIGAERLSHISALSRVADGKWGADYANITFDGHKYNVGGVRSADGEFTGLITFNFGEICTFDALGYIRGGTVDSQQGFTQAQKVYVSDDGINWTLVESASYDAVKMASDGKTLSRTTGDILDGDGQKGLNYFFDMNGVTGQYVRIGIIVGMQQEAAANLMAGTGIYTACWAEEQTINFRELLILGSK